MEDDKVGDKKLLMARGNKRHKKICGRLLYMSTDEK